MDYISTVKEEKPSAVRLIVIDFILNGISESNQIAVAYEGFNIEQMKEAGEWFKKRGFDCQTLPTKTLESGGVMNGLFLKWNNDTDWGDISAGNRKANGKIPTPSDGRKCNDIKGSYNR
jgi:hypothetical protein